MGDDRASVVRVEPAGLEVAVRPGETLFHAAQRLGIAWPTVCYGQARCTRCQVEVIEGNGRLGPVTEPEGPLLERIRLLHPQLRHPRLACQLRVEGDVVVRQPGVG